MTSSDDENEIGVLASIAGAVIGGLAAYGIYKGVKALINKSDNNQDIKDALSNSKRYSPNGDNSIEYSSYS